MLRLLVVIGKVLTAFLIFSPMLRAQFNVLETDRLKLVYFGEMQTYLVPHVVRCFENSFEFHMNLFEYDSKGKITVVLHDLCDLGNGSADAIPRNFVFVAIAPSKTFPGRDPGRFTLHAQSSPGAVD
jgi:hypothetical protein